jgi:hypothetical protein
VRALSAELRRQLETSVLAARRAAESGSVAALEGLGVFADRRPEHLGPEQAALRNELRAKGRQLGGDRELLVAECAYEQWHRLLFARFLAENQLLLHPQYKAPVTLADCEQLAAELGEPDGWSVAATFAAQILPGIFRLEDPCVRLRLAPEDRQALEAILDAIPGATFAADDALGWVYQFWQKDKKDEVNASERKIGGADLGPVTQLFTEDYMVRFLLENSLGAWWALRHPESTLVGDFELLRFLGDGLPAARSFEEWPDSVAEVTVMDPCCGSGHFLVEAFSMLWRMRTEELGETAVEAQDAVLRDNLFGLELDPRCVQIAMFAVALQAWKAGGRWRQLPTPNTACSGIPVKAPAEQWQELGKGNQRLERALGELHALFRDAETLGSLIDPQRAAGGLLRQGSLEDADWAELLPILQRAVGAEAADDPASRVIGADALGIVRATSLLARDYVLMATNPPYLGRGQQADVLRTYCLAQHAKVNAELANVMVDRWRRSASIAVVLPQNWLFMSTFEDVRKDSLQRMEWQVLARLGAGAFGHIGGHVVQVCLWIATAAAPAPEHAYCELDAAEARGPEGKAAHLRTGDIALVDQAGQLTNPEAVVVAGGALSGPFVSDVAEARAGLGTGDDPSFVRFFWEVPALGEKWELLQSAPSSSEEITGCEKVILWEQEEGRLARYAESVKHLNTATQGWRRGKPIWGRRGVVVKLMGNLNVTPYFGTRFDRSCAAIVPKDTADTDALWQFAVSGELERSIRSFHTKLSVETGTLLAAPIEVDRWRTTAGQNGAGPASSSRNPAQWLFEGRPEQSTAPMQVAVARLVGYRWPAQDADDDLDRFEDRDGIVCLPAVAGEPPGSDRVQQVLAAAYGHTWSAARTRGLLEGAGSRKKTLADWLRDEFFKNHCAIFANRPFVWHIWDGRRDGFSALVNYHRLDRKALEKLTFTYLGQDWVERQRAEVADDVPGAEDRLAAALALQAKLKLILEGETPHDIYVRWKPLELQPVGWDPDLEDGVRVNIRPFAEAGVLRSRVRVNWKKDRGKDPDGSERHNDVHLTLAEKSKRRAGGQGR